MKDFIAKGKLLERLFADARGQAADGGGQAEDGGGQAEDAGGQAKDQVMAETVVKAMREAVDEVVATFKKKPKLN